MKIAAIKPYDQCRGAIMEINDQNFGILTESVLSMRVGEKRTFVQADNDPGQWGEFGGYFDYPDSEMIIEIVEMSKKELGGLPEFEGW